MRSKKLILVVDDELPLVRALEEVLKKEKYGVITANDGEEGYQKASKQHPDLILLDILMPRLDGIGMLEKLRSCKDAYCHNVPIIILTNLVNQDFASHCKKLGCLDYIIKSDIALSDLISIVKTIVK